MSPYRYFAGDFTNILRLFTGVMISSDLTIVEGIG
jgi:hypothetical protein